MRIVAWNVFLASAISYSLNPAHAFLVVSNSNAAAACFSMRMPRTLNLQSKSSPPVTVTVRGTALRMGMSKKPAGDDDEEDDDDYIDDADLGDWRSFRRTLVDSDFTDDFSDGGFIGEASDTSSTATASASGTGTGYTSNSPSASAKAAAKAAASKDKKRPKSVSKKNEELLKNQSETLAKEYMEGIWAHEASLAEIAGLVVRLPLEAEIYRNREKLTIGKELKQRLENNNGNDKYSDNTPLLSSNNDNSEKGVKANLSFSLTAAQTLLWYKKSQTLIEEHMADIAALADESGLIDPRELDPKAENLLKLYLDNQESWQEVSLVAERNEMNGNAKTYVLNRPMAFRLSENLARLVLYGAFNARNDGGVAVSEMNDYTKFLRAFEDSCAVYIGGPDHMEKKADMIHGISDLEGAVEISPGTGIYRGGIEAAVEGVLDGRFQALDFRFFIGCHDYKDGDLDVKIYSNKYQPIACARALALKQCIQLPKPLWHEVMELCGGELREISRLELIKRDDIIE